MSATSAPDAFEVLKFTQGFLTKLEEAQALLEQRGAGEFERGWIAQGIALVSSEARGIPAVLEQVRALPELTELAARMAEEDQGRWVDALERLVAGITFTAGSRSPLIEALFPHQKWPVLRRAIREDVVRFQAEFERRSKAGYVTRLLAADELSVVRPVFDQVAQAFARWQACFQPVRLSAEELEGLRGQLGAAAARADRVVRQARLLAEAALLAAEGGAYEALGLSAKPRRRKVEPLTGSEASVPEASAPSVSESAGATRTPQDEDAAAVPLEVSAEHLAPSGKAKRGRRRKPEDDAKAEVNAPPPPEPAGFGEG